MIRLARDVDAEARAVRKIVEDEVEGVQTAQYALIARALFEDKGTSTYPDATFTLRLAFGVVKGYRGGRQARARRTPRSAVPSSTPRRTATPIRIELPAELVQGPRRRPARSRHAR